MHMVYKNWLELENPSFFNKRSISISFEKEGLSLHCSSLFLKLHQWTDPIEQPHTADGLFSDEEFLKAMDLLNALSGPVN